MEIFPANQLLRTGFDEPPAVAAAATTRSSVVITGGGGYLGYHVALALARSGRHRAVVLFDLRPPIPEWAKAFGDKHPEERKAVERIVFFGGSVCSFEQIELRGVQPSTLYRVLLLSLQSHSPLYPFKLLSEATFPSLLRRPLGLHRPLRPAEPGGVRRRRGDGQLAGDQERHPGRKRQPRQGTR